MRFNLTLNILTIKVPTVRQFVLFMLIAGLMPPQGIFVIAPDLGRIWHLWRIVACLVVVCLCISKKIIKLYIIPFIMFFLFIVINTFAWVGSPANAINTYSLIIVFILLVNYFENDVSSLLDILGDYLFLLATVNFVCLILFPDGMYKSATISSFRSNWFLGYKGSFLFYLYPLYIISLLNLIYSRRMAFSLTSVLLCLVELLLGGATSPFIASFIVGVLLLLTKEKKGFIFKPTACVSIILILNVFLVNKLLLDLDFVRNFITGVLKKNLTFTGRNVIWNSTLIAICKKPLLGYGVTSLEIRLGMYGTLQHAHNNLLEILYEGGIVWLVMFLLLMFFVCRNLERTIQLRSSRILSLSLFGLLIMSSTDPLTHQFDALNWLLIVLCCMSTQIEKQYSIYSDAKSY